MLKYLYVMEHELNKRKNESKSIDFKEKPFSFISSQYHLICVFNLKTVTMCECMNFWKKLFLRYKLFIQNLWHWK